MKLIFLVALFLSTCVPAYAQQSEPFVMPHPITGEQGVWIPPWVQELHLQTDAKLKLCTASFDADQQLIAEKNEEIVERIAATTNLQHALANTQTALGTAQTRQQEAETASENRLVWALVASGVAAVTGIILTIDVLR
jgi:hypothetical protein